MYSLSSSLLSVKGIGEKFFSDLQEKNISTVKDLLLNLPLHYLDRSELTNIAGLDQENEKTFQATVTSTSNFYRKGRSIQSASVKDESGRVKLMWFNNRFILQKLKKGESYLFCGKLNKRDTIVHPTVEDVGVDTIHSGRIVPVYSTTLGMQIGRLRRILKHILDNLKIEEKNDLANFITNHDFQNLSDSLYQLHFPDQENNVVKSRNRLAVEELLVLMEHSQHLKEKWQELAVGQKEYLRNISKEFIPKSIPFELTGSQKKATQDILGDLTSAVPMNRLLIGDVGAGKTVVAGIAAYHLYKNGHSSTLVSPTKILASQHHETISQLFPDVKVKLVTGKKEDELTEPAIYIGTHNLLNRFKKINPALIIYDEQHRFGVSHRSRSTALDYQPHVLTMTATPIPRSLILTIFAHLELSVIDEMPAGRLETISKLVDEKNRTKALGWIGEQVLDKTKQALIVCPFIEKSKQEAFAHVANVKEEFQVLKKFYQNQTSQPNLAMLHGKMKKKEQEEVTKDLFSGKIDILVTTPIVEVGVDLPGASIIVIKNAERFGLASLHQLRGRVGRRGQQGYCLLFSSTNSDKTKERLSVFTRESKGMKLAEFDLKNRGAGDIFGYAQSGLDTLLYANWADLDQISLARQVFAELDQARSKGWEPLLDTKKTDVSDLPLAN